MPLAVGLDGEAPPLLRGLRGLCRGEEVQRAVARDDREGRLSILVEAGPILAEADLEPPAIGVVEDDGVPVVELLGPLRGERGGVLAENRGRELAALANHVAHPDHQLLLPSRFRLVLSATIHPIGHFVKLYAQTGIY